jgi:hypothetical protein
MSAVQVIADITRRMGAGMAKYIQQDGETIADYHEYCQFVAGLVGVGLSQASNMPLHFILDVLLVVRGLLHISFELHTASCLFWSLAYFSRLFNSLA